MDHTGTPLKLQELISFKVTTLANTISRAVNLELERDFGVGITDHRILAVIGQNTSVSIKEITTLTRIDKGWISRSVNNMLQEGLITKNVDEVDARRVKLTLTDKGKILQQKLYQGSIRRNALLIESFTPGESAIMDELLAQLQEQADKLLTAALEE